MLGGELDCGTGVVWSGIAARAVSDGWTVKVDASLEKSAHPVVTVSRAAPSTTGSSRRRTRVGRGFESNIDINGTAPADLLRSARENYAGGHVVFRLIGRPVPQDGPTHGVHEQERVGVDHVSDLGDASG